MMKDLQQRMQTMEAMEIQNKKEIQLLKNENDELKKLVKSLQKDNGNQNKKEIHLLQNEIDELKQLVNYKKTKWWEPFILRLSLKW